MATYWTNFAKYGDPNGVSPPPRSVPTTHGGFGQTRHQPHQLRRRRCLQASSRAVLSHRLVQGGKVLLGKLLHLLQEDKASLRSALEDLRCVSQVSPCPDFLVLVSSLFQRPTVVTVTQPSTSSAPPLASSGRPRHGG
ncbi:hypothetical protein BaRGS_00018029 [Batillaria attramentaria]|uniref:Carboxylesterase type B domain-containing protein n=1 Tax=Batillaria attramentaria TaxID=370345 RepID=A0ABD0KUG1_9CAEN